MCVKEKRLPSYSSVHDSEQQFIGALCVLYWTSNGVHIIIHACPFAFYMSPDLIFTVGLVSHLLVLSVKTLHLREVMGDPSQLGDSHWS